MGRRRYYAPEDAAPWDRQTGEGARAWEQFQLYRDLGPSRSLRQVAETLGKSMSQISKISAQQQWTDRVQAWDREQDRLAQQAQIDAIREMRREHALLGKALRTKATNALRQFPTEEIKAADIARLAEVGTRMERIAHGDVGDVVEERTGESMPPVTFYMPDNQREDNEA